MNLFFSLSRMWVWKQIKSILCNFLRCNHQLTWIARIIFHFMVVVCSSCSKFCIYIYMCIFIVQSNWNNTEKNNPRDLTGYIQLCRKWKRQGLTCHFFFTNMVNLVRKETKIYISKWLATYLENMFGPGFSFIAS